MLGVLLTTLLPALMPAAIDGVKAGINKLTGDAGAQPSNFAERMEWEKFALDKLRLIADLDRPSGTISQWVADFRASIRYIAITLILLIYGTVTLGNLPMGTEEYQLLAQLTSAAVFFLLGERVYMNLRGAK